MVPTYSPGLPLTMAAFKAVGGENAVYLVVPLLGALSVWLTYVLGLHLAGATAGALAALMLLASPTFLFQLMWPMSDVPAMALWLAAVVLVLQPSSRSTAASGLAAAAAILTRPNLVVLAVPLLMLIALEQRTWRARIVAWLTWSAAAGIGVVADALINRHLYGSATFSGYGTFSTIYAAAHFWTNVVQFPRWLLQTESPLIVLSIAAPFVLRWRGTAGGARLAVWGMGLVAVVLLSYLWYTPYDNWTYLRFLLPAYPVLMASAAAVVVAVAPDAGARRTAMFAVVVVAVTAWGLWQGRPAFEVRASEARYRTAARLATGLPDNAVIICNQHSGSLRYYANRLTVRYEWLYPDVYSEAVQYLHSIGRPVFAVLDDWERDVFRMRYAGHADLSWLDRPAIVVADERVYFYKVSP